MHLLDGLWTLITSDNDVRQPPSCLTHISEGGFISALRVSVSRKKTAPLPAPFIKKKKMGSKWCHLVNLLRITCLTKKLSSSLVDCFTVLFSGQDKLFNFFFKRVLWQYILDSKVLVDTRKHWKQDRALSLYSLPNLWQTNLLMFKCLCACVWTVGEKRGMRCGDNHTSHLKNTTNQWRVHKWFGPPQPSSPPLS